MKKVILLLLGLIITSNAISRDIINFNDNWLFGKSISNSTISRYLTLPHTWQRHETDPLHTAYRGAYQYLKEFKVPVDWMSKSVFIRFNGVASIANVFINGKYVGEHRGAYTAFTFDISPYLNYGSTNTILVNVDNSVQLDVMPLSGDFNVYGGIYRDVELIITNKTHISTTHYSSNGVYVNQFKLNKKEAEINVKTILKGQYGDKGTVQVKILKENKVIETKNIKFNVGIESDNTFDFPIKIDNPRVWNAKKDPFLYRCQVSVFDFYGEERDFVEVTFGLRKVAINRQKGFMLNDENYPLYGVTYMQDRENVYSAMTRANIREDIDIIEEIGATAVRTSNAPHSKYFYDLTDKKGIVTWVDLPFIGDDIDKGASYINSASFMNNGKNQLEEMIYQLYNHPSVVFLGLFSNISGYGDSPLPFIKDLNAIAQSISPNRLTVACSNEDGAVNNVTDAISWSQYLGWRSRSTSDINIWLNSFRNEWHNLKPGIGEYGAGGSIFQQSEETIDTKEKEYKHPESSQTQFHIDYSKYLRNRPYIWGYFVNSIFDYGSSHRFYGGLIGQSDLGLVTYNRHTKKDAFYLYKALWNKDEKFIYLTESRLEKRNNTKQNIKVFSSCRTVDLIVNGVSHSTITVIDGIASWDNVNLKIGKNTITARNGDIKDSMEITVYN